jgi:flagellar protein FlbD
LILVTKLNRSSQFWVNENLIETMEETPDTILSMATGRKITVAEPVEKVAEMINQNWLAARPAAGALVRKLLDGDDEK